MTKILTEKAINDHYDKVKAYITPLSMRTAEETAKDIEEERTKALAMFKRDGFLKVKATGVVWKF